MAIDAISMFAHIGVITGAYYIGSLLGAYVELDPDPAISTAHTGVWIAFVSDNAGSFIHALYNTFLEVYVMPVSNILLKFIFVLCTCPSMCKVLF